MAPQAIVKMKGCFWKRQACRPVGVPGFATLGRECRRVV